MFTGIVEEIGQVVSLVAGREGGRLVVQASTVLEGTRVGDSIAANGVCLTVAACAATTFTADVMPETLRRSNLGGLRPGNRLNLERAVAYGGRVGGHYVQGHVDGLAMVRSLVRDGQAVIVELAVDPEVGRYLVTKGFVALDGASLTLVEARAGHIAVSLVAHTLRSITLPQRLVGEAVNVEIDIIAKYVERLCAAATDRPKELTLETLERHGFARGRTAHEE